MGHGKVSGSHLKSQGGYNSVVGSGKDLCQIDSWLDLKTLLNGLAMNPDGNREVLT